MKFFSKYSLTQKNVFFSIAQVIINGISLFVAYRFAILLIGAEIFGVWAIINSFASFLSVTNFGISGAFVRYIPHYLVEGRNKEIAALIFTNVSFFLVFGTFLGVIIFFISNLLIPFIIETKYLVITYSILKLSIALFIMNVAVGLFSSILDGYSFIYKRNIIQIIGSLFFLIIIYFFVKKWGINGFIWAQLTQSFLLLILLIFVCFNIVKGRYCWNFRYIKETFSYGFQSQVISLMQIGYEPVIKILLGKYGGVTSVSYFELSNKIVLQVRGIIINAFQYLIPLFASIKEKNELIFTYEREFKKIKKVTIVAFSIIILFSPIISMFFLHIVRLHYVYIITTISLSWAINTISAPAYFFNMGRGILRKNIETHIIFIFTTIFLSTLLGNFMLDLGIVLGMLFANILSTYYILTQHSNMSRF